MKSFKELIVWQKAHQLTLDVYKTTSSFPSHELYGLTSQMRRAAVSVPANIAEGFKRISKKEKLRFYNMSQASLEELRYFFILSGDLNYASNTTELEQLAVEVSKLQNSLITSILNSLQHD